VRSALHQPWFEDVLEVRYLESDIRTQPQRLLGRLLAGDACVRLLVHTTGLNAAINGILCRGMVSPRELSLDEYEDAMGCGSFLFGRCRRCGFQHRRRFAQKFSGDIHTRARGPWRTFAGGTVRRDRHHERR
jgi:hypothetical protein